MKSSLFLAASISVVALVSGCRGSEKPPVTAADDGSKGRDATARSASGSDAAVDRALQENQGGGLAFSDEVLRACPGIKSPKFGFDSSKLGKEWSEALSALATCMNEGGLKGRGVLLTGHTDNRGDDDYNMVLGGRRADAVRTAVSTFGVDPHRVDVTSRGKVDAVGNDEESWARDRRVDIDVLKPRVSAR
jgi:peptidoglycan-associated lipoprotein